LATLFLIYSAILAFETYIPKLPAFLLALLSVAHLSAAEMNSFHIGNSLMSDGTGGSVGGITGLEYMADYYGHDHTLGYHLDGSQSINSIWANPNGVDGVEGFRPEFGFYTQALTNFAWDAVLLQPHLTNGSTLGSDKQNIANFVNLARQNPANANTVFYVYQTWPSQTIYGAPSGKKYYNYWKIENNEENFPGDARPTRSMRSYYRDLMNDLATEQPDTAFRLIPAGEVFNRLSLMDLPGDLEIEDFYRDPVHMSQNLGRYVAATTIYSTLFGQDMRDFVPPVSYYNPTILTPELRTIINQVIYEVVRDSRGDFNYDGVVNQLDLSAWQAGFVASRLNGRDFLNWQRAFVQPSATILQVPEPGVLSLLAAAMLLCTARHRRRR
jgi:hypothetical protein